MKKPFIMIVAILFFGLLLMMPIVQAVHVLTTKTKTEQQVAKKEMTVKKEHKNHPEMYRYGE